MIEQKNLSMKTVLREELQKEEQKVSQKSDKSDSKSLEQQKGDVEAATQQEAPESLAEFKKKFVVPRPQQAMEVIRKIRADGKIDRSERKELNDIIARANESGEKKTATQLFLETYAKQVNADFDQTCLYNTYQLPLHRRLGLQWFKNKKTAAEVEADSVKAFKPRQVYDRPDALFRDWIDAHVEPETALSAEEAIKVLNQQIREGGATMESLMIEASRCVDPMAIAAAFSLLLKQGESEEDRNILMHFVGRRKANVSFDLLREAFMIAAPELKHRPIPFLAGLRSLADFLGLQDEAPSEPAKEKASANDPSALRTRTDLYDILADAMMDRDPPISPEEAERVLNAMHLFGEESRCQQFALSMIEKGWAVESALLMLSEKDDGRAERFEKDVEDRIWASAKKFLASGSEAHELLDAVASQAHLFNRGPIDMLQELLEEGVGLDSVLDLEHLFRSRYNPRGHYGGLVELTQATGTWLLECLSRPCAGEEAAYAEGIVAHMLRRHKSHGVSQWTLEKTRTQLRRAIQLAQVKGVSQDRLRELVNSELDDDELKETLGKDLTLPASQVDPEPNAEPSLRELLQG